MKIQFNFKLGLYCLANFLVQRYLIANKTLPLPSHFNLDHSCNVKESILVINYNHSLTFLNDNFVVMLLISFLQVCFWLVLATSSLFTLIVNDSQCKEKIHPGLVTSTPSLYLLEWYGFCLLQLKEFWSNVKRFKGFTVYEQHEHIISKDLGKNRKASFSMCSIACLRIIKWCAIHSDQRAITLTFSCQFVFSYTNNSYPK